MKKKLLNLCFRWRFFFGCIKIHSVNTRSKLLESFNRTNLLLISHCEPMQNKTLRRLYTNRIYQARRIPIKRKQQSLFLSAFYSWNVPLRMWFAWVWVFLCVCVYPVRPVLRITINTLHIICQYTTMTVKPGGKFLKEIITLLTKSWKCLIIKKKVREKNVSVGN